jgi:hypothetical protein
MTYSKEEQAFMLKNCGKKRLFFCGIIVINGGKNFKKRIGGKIA